MKQFIDKLLSNFNVYKNWKNNRKLKKKLEELKKRDPFIYK